MQGPYQDITEFLARSRAACHRASVLEVLLFCAIVMTLSCLAGLLSAAVIDRWVGVSVGLAGVCVSVWGTWRLWWRPWRRRRSDPVMARWVEKRVGHLYSGVVTAVETKALIENTPASKELGFSRQLAQAAAAQTASILRQVRPRDLVGFGRIKRLARQGGVTLLLALAVLALGGPTLSEGWAVLSSPIDAAQPTQGGRHADVAVGNFNLQIRPPAYLDLESRELMSPDGSFEAVRGSEVRYVATAEEAIEAAVIVFESQPEARWPVSVRDARVLEGRLRVGESDRYRFIVTLADGAVLHESRWRLVTATLDQPPTVRLLLPDSDLEVHADDEVPLLFEAADDYGLAEVNVVVTGPDGGEAFRAAVKTLEGARSGRGTYSLHMSKIALQPGQSAQVAFEARDINTLDGPGITFSAARTLTLYSPERQHEELLGNLKRLIDTLVDVIADRLESPIERRRVEELADYIATHVAISKREALAVEALETLSAALGADPLADAEFRSTLASIVKTFKAAHEQEAAQLRRAAKPDMVAPRAPVMTQLLFTANNEGIAALETTIFDLKRLLDKARQDRVLELGRDMLEVQNELRELLEKAAKGDADARRRAMAKLAELRSRLRRMQQEMVKMAERVPYENQNLSPKKAGDRSDARSIGEQMAKIEQLLQEGKVDEAMKLLEELNRDTQELMAGLQSDFSQAKMTQTARKEANKFQEQLGQVADGQRGLRSETGQLRQRQSQQQASDLQRELKDAANDAQDLAKRLRNVDGAGVNPRDRSSLDALQRSAGKVLEHLKNSAPEAAEATSREIAKGAAGLAKEAGEGASRELDNDRVQRMERAQKELDEAAGVAQQLAKRLRGIMEAAQRGSAGTGGPEMKRLGKRQGKLAKRLNKLGESLESLDKELPGVQGKLRQDLEKARENMKSASKDLQKGKGEQARDQQDAALERLDKAMRSLEQSMKRRRGASSDREQAGTNDPRQRVVIPADEAVPRRFREEVLKAMKERAPKKFRKRIDRYYKELVK